ncbi:cytochrome P450 [Nocardia sp. NPDC049149]|uniref:cytochrome P450 n=1 Tax=Nocardia sp. NPDC049149 TaxID=3364315 RepID=UPI00371811A5
MVGTEPSARKVDRGEVDAACPVARGADGVWRINGYAPGVALLRAGHTVQDGLGIETVAMLPKRIRKPVVFQDGVEHRDHRRETARYFAPRWVDEHYRDLMVRVADAQIDTLRRAGSCVLSDLSFSMAIEVAAAVVGVRGGTGIQRRLERFFPERVGRPGLTSWHGLYWLGRLGSNWLRVYWCDVRPAVRLRRKEPRDDLISHLLAEGWTEPEMLGECLTYAAAGMITTREFVNVAAWHLFTDESLRQRYREAAEPERIALLHEILRLEPVVGSLRRRTTAAIEVPGPDGPVVIPPGERVDVVLGAVNVDPAVMGERPMTLCPGRAVAPGTAEAGLSFGAGPHRCPGAHIAILETDIFLSRLFAMDGVSMKATPRVTFDEVLTGYVLREMVIALPDSNGA